MAIRSLDDARFELEAALKKHKRWDRVVNNWRDIAEKNSDTDPVALQKWYDNDPDNAKYFEQAIGDVMADTCFLMRRAQMWWIMEMMAKTMDEMVAEAEDARIDAAQAELGDIPLDKKIGEV